MNANAYQELLEESLLPLSPDLNPKENAWGLLSRAVNANGQQYNNIVELKAAIISKWEEIEQNQLKTLVNSMPNRLFKVIHKQGKFIVVLLTF
uniref:Uncharacterized protein n=1 Tax=Strigamia maritima TaxID=126957 RepID=T1IMZ2_STRMM